MYFTRADNIWHKRRFIVHKNNIKKDNDNNNNK